MLGIFRQTASHSTGSNRPFNRTLWTLTIDQEDEPAFGIHESFDDLIYLDDLIFDSGHVASCSLYGYDFFALGKPPGLKGAAGQEEPT